MKWFSCSNPSLGCRIGLSAIPLKCSTSGAATQRLGAHEIGSRFVRWMYRHPGVLVPPVGVRILVVTDQTADIGSAIVPLRLLHDRTIAPFQTIGGVSQGDLIRVFRALLQDEFVAPVGILLGGIFDNRTMGVSI